VDADIVPSGDVLAVDGVEQRGESINNTAVSCWGCECCTQTLSTANRQLVGGIHILETGIYLGIDVHTTDAQSPSLTTIVLVSYPDPRDLLLVNRMIYYGRSKYP
jgi:hypothetical protein